MSGSYSTRTQRTWACYQPDDSRRRIQYAHGEWMMFRNFNFNDIEMLGEVMLATVALLVPVLVFTLFLTA